MDSTPDRFFGPGDATRLTAGLERVLSAEQAIAALHAERIRALAAIAETVYGQIARIPSRDSRERELPLRSAAAEIGFATRRHDRTVQNDLHDALTLTTRFAATVDALEAGVIGMPHVNAVLDTGHSLDDPDTRAGWEARVLAYAAEQSPNRTRAYARELADALSPMSMEEQAARIQRTQQVTVVDLDGGVSELRMVDATARCHAIKNRLTRIAREHRTHNLRSNAEIAADRARNADTAGVTSNTVMTDDTPASVAVIDTRTLRQIETDLLADLLLTGTPAIDPTITAENPAGLGAIHATIQVVIPVTTLTGMTDHGATLNGRAPIDTATARRLAGEAPGWDRIMVHPVTGTVLEVDRYEPTTAQRRYLRARDRHCRAPGCRQPATRCEIDHNHEHHYGGKTSLGNLAHLCVRHHTLKTETPWTVHQRADGTLAFTSPLGRTTEDPPPPRVMFVPSDELAPF